MKLKIKAIALATGVLAAAPFSASAATVNLFDGAFGNVTFLASNPSRPYGFGPSAGNTPLVNITASIIANVDQLTPDPHAIAVQYQWPVGSTLSAGLGILDNALTYNPQSSGAISSLSLSLNKMLLTNNAGSAVRFLLQQNGNYYTYVTPNQQNFAVKYANYTTTSLGSSDFTQVCLVNCGSGKYGLAPATLTALDFTSTAGQITFGILSSNSSAGPSLTNIFFDNFKVNIDYTNAPAAPEASTWAMMMLGFAGIGLVTYRKKKAGAASATA